MSFTSFPHLLWRQNLRRSLLVKPRLMFWTCPLQSTRSRRLWQYAQFFLCTLGSSRKWIFIIIKLLLPWNVIVLMCQQIENVKQKMIFYHIFLLTKIIRILFCPLSNLTWLLITYQHTTNKHLNAKFLYLIMNFTLWNYACRVMENNYCTLFIRVH